MRGGWGCVVLVAGLLLGLLLCLAPLVDSNAFAREDHFGTCSHGEPASTFPSTWILGRPAFLYPVVPVKESVPDQRTRMTRAPSPPGRDSHRPPEPIKATCHGWAKRSTQSNKTSTPLRNFRGLPIAKF